MINAKIYRSNEGLITAFILSGHAEFDEYGKDIVCAGASAVTFGAVNAVLSLTNIEPQIDQGGEGGYLKVEIPENLDASTSDKVQLLLEGMVVSLQTIEREYGQYISVTHH
ncbi:MULTISPECIES: ribosomal-processing cysteine protease Prp [Bacillaceae]|uniref:Ribosomal processing cysteine protease Prp n=1 Tax=Metabacillus endolithicus TaxID=1535204 RepID=A0ABW5BYR9_9BACI|nr:MULTISPECIES: ribosomal-processing cysteine protease Prp [Bacillaceae]MCM3165018.1 ribosomal-processing cysteine protease Prp [Metabacillus litoralis]MCM3413113.1 ribosomal-processing cysteine protease Prp [Metabacillus litoralis]PGT80620.1 ribosomal-processing cysteine protease Prp [Bacillus sp. AFS040349]UGB29668.1 ribosomal-processing cysteine protease Prp [Metabacillus sp. B2-18]UHA62347.1 ribosomal-processing cysteine protease Prp [Metabacillus litoralis]